MSHNCWRKGTYKTETASVRATQPSQRLASVSCDCRGKPWSGPHPTITIIGQPSRDFCTAASVLWPSTCMSSPTQPSNVLCVDNSTTPRRAMSADPCRYTVHATTRSEEKAAHLLKLPGAAERLKIFSGCDLLKIGSFGAAVEGCETVLHTASPFYSHGGSEDALVRPAVDGTRNVLLACVAHGVKEVVLTASTANVYVVYGACAEARSPVSARSIFCRFVDALFCCFVLAL